MIRLLLAAALSGLLPLGAMAQSDTPAHDTSAPIKLEADTGSIDTQKGLGIYQGNVTVSQGNFTVRGETLVILARDRRLSSAEITGNPAHFEDRSVPDRAVKAEAPTIRYMVTEKTLQLLDGARLTQGNNTLKGNKIDYQLDSGYVSAEGAQSTSERVEILLFPDTQDNSE